VCVITTRRLTQSRSIAAVARVCIDAACVVGRDSAVGLRHNCHRCHQPLHGACGVALSALEPGADVDLRVCTSCATVVPQSATQTAHADVAVLTGAHTYAARVCVTFSPHATQTAVCIGCWQRARYRCHVARAFARPLPAASPHRPRMRFHRRRVREFRLHRRRS
jgi:hypothetical protein